METRHNLNVMNEGPKYFSCGVSETSFSFFSGIVNSVSASLLSHSSTVVILVCIGFSVSGRGTGGD